MRSIFPVIILLLAFTSMRAQVVVEKKRVDTVAATTDTGYVNKGKIIGKKAFQRSLIFPGLGQMYNYGLIVDDIKSGRIQTKRVGQKIYIISKIGAIYAGGTILVLSYIDNRHEYKRFLTELQYRSVHNNEPDPKGGLAQYTNTQALTTAKNIYKRNSQIVLFTLVGLYGLNALDAYITARLKYFSVDETLSFKVSPTTIQSNTMYGFSPSPGVKLSIRF